MRTNTLMLLVLTLLVVATTSCKKEELNEGLAGRLVGDWTAQVEVLRFGSSTTDDIRTLNTNQMSIRSNGTGTFNDREQFTWTVEDENKVKLTTVVEVSSGNITIENNFNILENEENFQHWNDTRTFTEGGDNITVMYIYKLQRQ